MSEPLKRIGQIQDGDTVATTYKGKREIWRDVTVLKEGETTEEILLKAKGNIYFITSMALDGSSWASNVEVTTY